MRTGPAVVAINGNPYWQSLLVMNLDGAGTYDALSIKGKGDRDYVPLKRDWGANFVHDGQIRAPISLKMVRKDQEVELVDCVPDKCADGHEYVCSSAARTSSTSCTAVSRRVTLQDTKERLLCSCTCKNLS